MSIYAQIKTCSKCGIEKSTTDFYKSKTTKDKLNAWCKSCVKDNTHKNYKLNGDRIKQQKKDYYNKNKEICNEKCRLYSKNNRKTINENKRKYHNNRISIDPLYKLKHNLRTLIRNSIKKKKFHKNTKTQDILGCDYNTLKEHLENQFDSNMNWGNQGTYWDIDHIIPTSSAKTEEELIKLNHYTNLQPLESYYNRYVKGSNIQPPP